MQSPLRLKHSENDQNNINASLNWWLVRDNLAVQNKNNNNTLVYYRVCKRLMAGGNNNIKAGKGYTENSR